MKRSHLTEACEHDESKWCQHCEEGCQYCGALEDVSDDGFCPDCTQSRAENAADMLYESMRDGD